MTATTDSTTPSTAPAGFLPRRIEFREARPETRDVTTFRFALGKDAFEWKAGQFLEMEFPGLQDPRGATRLFTISSSPTETGSLTISTKIGESPFKARLKGLRVGESVSIKAPDGDFVLDPARPGLLLAGGIGITPFRSMLRFATDVHLDQSLVLVYSNRTPEDIVFREELDKLARRNPRVQLIHTITRPDQSNEPWPGHVGRVDADLLATALRGLDRPIAYVAGPPGLVREHRRLLVDANLVPETDLRTDEFDGY